MSPERQVTVTLAPELAEFVRREAQRGGAASEADFLRALAQERFDDAKARAAKLQALDDAIARGLADAEAGRVMPLDEAMAKLRAQLGLPAQSAAE